MKLYTPSLFALLLSVNAFAVDLPSDEELMRQGRAAMQMNNAKIDAIVKNPSVYPGTTLNLGANSPLLEQPRAHGEQKTFLDVATGKKKSSALNPAKKYDLMIFVSFSMPDDILKQYTKQAVEYGAVLVLRGMHQGSIEKTKLRAIDINQAAAEIDIAPAAYKKFKIDHAPAIVLADASQESVLENGCAKEGDYLRVDGDVSLHQALILMRQQGSNSTLVKGAEAFLEIENR